MMEEPTMKRLLLFPLITMAALLLLGYTPPLFSQEPENTFQKGLVKEEGEGALMEAIKLYSQVAEDESAERSLRAKALLHVGICYEKLGQNEAKKAYQKLIADFGDQGEIVSIGKKKLAILNSGSKTTKSEDLIIRQVWAPAEDVYGVSPDGRYLNYIDWNAIELAVKDLQTGKTWNITNKGTWKAPQQFPDNSVWSPDSKQIAYFWYNGDSTELHIINQDGSGDRVVCKGKGEETPWPITWSSEDNSIIAWVSSVDETNPQTNTDQVVSVSTADGSISVLKSFYGAHCGCDGSVSPDNQYFVVSKQQQEGSEQNDIFIFALKGEWEERIVSGPYNDINPVWIPGGRGIVFLSNRLGTNDLWTLELQNGFPAGEPELLKSNLGDRTHILGITNNDVLFYDYLNLRRDIALARLDFSSGEVLSEPEIISSIEEDRNLKPMWSPDGRYAAYQVLPSYQDYVLGQKYEFIIHDLETASNRSLKADLYGASRNFWSQPRWSPDGKYLLADGRTDEDKLQGFFLIDVLTGEREPVMVKEREPRSTMKPVGLIPIFSSDGKDIFYLTADRKEIVSRNLATKKEKKIFTGEDEILQLKLSPDGTVIVFGYFCCHRNALYSIPANGGEKRLLVETPEKTTPYMVSWTPDQAQLIVIVRSQENKEPHEIISVSFNGGDPERVFILNDLFPQGSIVNMEVHPDGQQVVLEVELGQGTEVLTMENLFK
jgi:Tol biopolymer transport system component